MISRFDIEELIDKYEERNDFTGKTSTEQIKLLEKNLEISFSSDYKWFLRKYGSGGVLGIDILGIGKSNISTVSKTTDRLRKEFNLEDNLYTVEDCDEFFYCGKSKEDKIYYWDKESGLGQVEANTFLKFLSDRILGAVENLK